MKKKKPEPSFFKLRFRTRQKNRVRPNPQSGSAGYGSVLLLDITQDQSSLVWKLQSNLIPKSPKIWKEERRGKCARPDNISGAVFPFISLSVFKIYSCSWNSPSPVCVQTTLNQPFRLIHVSCFSKDLVFAGFAVHNFCRGSDYAISIPRSGFKAGDADPVEVEPDTTVKRPRMRDCGARTNPRQTYPGQDQT